jgi:hypothetical protein
MPCLSRNGLPKFMTWCRDPRKGAAKPKNQREMRHDAPKYASPPQNSEPGGPTLVDVPAPSRIVSYACACGDQSRWPSGAGIAGQAAMWVGRVHAMDSSLVSEPPTASEGANYARALGDPWMYRCLPAVVAWP